MKILVIDAQGGGIGRQLITEIRKLSRNDQITAVGTNSVATSAMLKAGADIAATGENAVRVNARSADVIIGPIGIVIADAMYGEITPVMAQAHPQSDAVKILLPVNKCDNYIAGVDNLTISHLIDEALKKLVSLA